jgi:stage V sporulation protein SpoVS
MALTQHRACAAPMRDAIVPPSLRVARPLVAALARPRAPRERVRPAAAATPAAAREPAPAAAEDDEDENDDTTTTTPTHSHRDPVLVSALSNRDTIAALVAERLAEQDQAFVWATGSAAQFVLIGALAEAQPLLGRLRPGYRLEAAARWAGSTDYEPDEQKRRLRKLEVWARAVPVPAGVEEERQRPSPPPTPKRPPPPASAPPVPRLSADRTRERDELVAALSRQLWGEAAAVAAARPAPPSSLAAVAAAALTPAAPAPAPAPAAAAAAKKKRGRPPKKAAEAAAAPPPAAASAEAAAASTEGAAGARGVAEVEARGEQAVLRAVKAVLFLQQQPPPSGSGSGSTGTTTSGPSVLVIAPRADMVADTAAERRGEPPRQVPGVVLEVRAIVGGGGGGAAAGSGEGGGGGASS